MDLALAFGLPVGVLSRLLTERELWEWDAYARKKMLPQRRLELYLAQISKVIAQTMAGAEVSISDFLFDPKREEVPEADLEAAKLAFGFNPQRK